MREGYAAVMAGKPVCIPGTANTLSAAAIRPIPQRLQYILGRSLNTFD